MSHLDTLGTPACTLRKSQQTALAAARELILDWSDGTIPYSTARAEISRIAAAIRWADLWDEAADGVALDGSLIDC